MTPEWKEHNKPFHIALFFLCLVFSLEFISIFVLNQGHFTFSLDDPYIHLALAENIFKGHYGVNLSEYSAPSSSAIWPFLLSPFAGLSIAPYMLILMNVIATCFSLRILWKIWLPNSVTASNAHRFVATLFLLLSIPAMNLIGIAYTGMEHSFQLLFSLLIIAGLIYEIQHRKLAWWLVAAIITAPLFRYECLALSGPACLFLLIRGYRWQSIITGLATLGILGAFAAFLMSMDLNPFPTSIMAKSSVVSSGGGLGTLLSNLNRTLSTDRGILLVLGMIYLMYVAFNKSRENGLRLLAGTVFIGCALHTIVGRYGWYDRYEIYIWAALLSTIVYLNTDNLSNLVNNIGKIGALVLGLFATFSVCASYIITTLSSPFAANNIYQQQYQMHRFVSEFYKQPVAVNDLGYVAYNNENYVLDLWGLASVEALQLRQSKQQASWMAKITEKQNVHLVMIYDDWFTDIPAQWNKMGELKLGGRRVTVSRDKVAFYITDCKYANETQVALNNFAKTLPPKVTFAFVQNRCLQ